MGGSNFRRALVLCRVINSAAARYRPGAWHDAVGTMLIVAAPLGCESSDGNAAKKRLTR